MYNVWCTCVHLFSSMFLCNNNNNIFLPSSPTVPFTDESSLYLLMTMTFYIFLIFLRQAALASSGGLYCLHGCTVTIHLLQFSTKLTCCMNLYEVLHWQSTIVLKVLSTITHACYFKIILILLKAWLCLLWNDQLRMCWYKHFWFTYQKNCL